MSGPSGAALPSAERATLAGLLALGLGLRLWQYLARTSLWADEANMALNLVGRSLPELFGPLDHRQVAPAGWLVLEKAAVGALGEGELALRLVPFLSSVAALVLFWRLAARVLEGPAVVLAVGLSALGIPFVAYAAQVKPYSGDVAVACGVLLLALDAQERGFPARRVAWLALGGAAAVWLSLPAALILAGAGAALALSALRGRDRRAVPALAVALPIWAGSGALALLVASRGLDAAAAAYMERFWAGSFWPIPPRSVEDALWPLVRLSSVFGGGSLRYPLPGVFMALAALGVHALWRTRRDAALLLLLPIGATALASAAHRYPFSARVLLFLVPACLLCVAAGAARLGALPRPGGPLAGRVAMAACAALAAAALVRYPPPYAPEHLRPVLEAVLRDREAGDRIYVYYGVEKAFRYYARRLDLPASDYVLGGCWRDEPRAYLRELDRLRGVPRAWIVLTHALPDLREEPLILGYLDRIGIRRGAHRVEAHAREGRAATAAAYLYDLSDPARLAAGTADATPVPARDGPSLAWSC